MRCLKNHKLKIYPDIEKEVMEKDKQKQVFPIDGGYDTQNDSENLALKLLFLNIQILISINSLYRRNAP